MIVEFGCPVGWIKVIPGKMSQPTRYWIDLNLVGSLRLATL